jgi:hypothetical protein
LRDHKLIPVVLSLEELNHWETKIRQDNIHICYRTPLETSINQPMIILTPIQKSEALSETTIQTVLSILNNLDQERVKIYTDGSKTKDKVGCAFFIPETKESKEYKLPSESSIFTAEAVAITEALRYVQSSSKKLHI